MARILLGVSGGIAAYKAVELVRLATAAGHSVRVLQTPASLNFVGRATFEGVTGAPVLVEGFEPDPARGAWPGEPALDHDPISHLALARRADVLCIAPASANTIAKLAGGLADNLLTEAALACTAPTVVAPAMNNHMYEHPATRANVELLRSRGVAIVEPESGRLASRGEWGVGRLAPPASILSAVEAELGVAGGALDGLRVLVTAGGTREPIDSVRFVGNRSSGRMGLALAEEAALRGADVTLLAANVTLPKPSAARVIEVETAADLLAAGQAAFADADVLLMAAAVADFRPAEALEAKIAKAGRDRLALELEPTEDVLAKLARPAHGRPDARRLRRRARRGGRRTGPGQARAQGAGRRGGERHLALGYRLRRARQRGDDRDRGGRAPRSDGLQAGRGGGHPGPGRGAAGRGGFE